MKAKLFITCTILSISIVFSCKKNPQIPGSNKVTIGQTTIDTSSYFNAQISTIINDLGGNTIIQHGHCWSLEKEPTINDAKSILGVFPQPKKIESELTELVDNTTYYVRSYLSTNVTTIYGAETSFTTLKTGIPGLSTYDVTNITFYSAECSGNVSVDSGLFVTSRGFCWDTDSIFTIDNCIDTLVAGDSLGSFLGIMENLNEGINYYVKAYAINDKGVGYGDVVSFSTVAITLPELTTTQISEISAVGAHSGGNVTSNGNGSVTAKGVCWNISDNPTLIDNLGYTNNGDGLGSFSSFVYGLSENTKYYVCAYATNEKGTRYGQVLDFNTLEIVLPEVTTNSVSNITATTAFCGGNINNDGNGNISEKGICWNTTGNPSLDNNNGYTNEGVGAGSFTSQLTELEEQTIYYVCAYGSNEKGTSYGNIIEFITSEGPCGGQLNIFYEGETYPIVEIGSQCWMAKNLNIGLRIDGDQNQSDNGEIEKYCYNDTEDNCDIYGGLYQWNELMQYITSEGTQGICPGGWHLPMSDEFELLSDFLGGEDIAGGKLKEIGLNHWNEPNTGATDAYGFTALPGGVREHSQGTYWNVGNVTGYWSSSLEVPSLATKRIINNTTENLYLSSSFLDEGSSVRCIKNE